MTTKLCECGCGEPTWIPVANNRQYGWVKGVPVRFKGGHNFKNRAPGRYPGFTMPDGRPNWFHRARAEKALGKPLPPNADVHHADGSKDPNAPLVICQDAAYHNLLHLRMRVKKAGGDPNSQRICSRCRQLKPFAAFNKFKYGSLGLSTYCKACKSTQRKEYRLRRAS